MSKIAIIGATGRAGSQLLEEALRRGHSVTAIARHASKIGARDGVVIKDVDINDARALQDAVAGNDVVLSAAHFSTQPAAAIIEPVKKAGSNPCCLSVARVRYCCPTILKVIESLGFPRSTEPGSQRWRRLPGYLAC